MNKVNILFFATLRDKIGARKLELDLPMEATVGELKDLLVQDHPALLSMREHIMAAINREYAGDEQVIPPQAEIALFPPVSGG
jgi:molybdopterin converting factor subunit 1